MEVPLPSGATVTVRERLKNADRKVYMRAIEDAPEIEASVPMFERDEHGNVLKDDHDRPVTLKDEHGNTLTERKMVIPSSVLLDNVDTLMRRLVVAWTVKDENGDPLPLPSSVEDRNVFDEMDLDDYDALSAKMKPFISKFFPNFEPTLDQEAPTGPSSD